ncbi:MAG TPA: DUF5985 family protein [Verrucomicrobiae bacterium]|nr:DUF5985 family protein [Verrucomicrobiae bacterium]
MSDYDFIRGVVAMGFLVASAFFFRFWRESRDRLFALFAVAFLLLTVNRVLLTVFHEDREYSPTLYLLRLLAFLIILAAIIDKNLRRT